MLGNRKMGSRRFAGALLAAALLSGCGAAGLAPRDATATVSASPDVNPDASQRPSPIVVRIYQLKSGAVLDQSDYFKLTSDPQGALGDTLVAHDQALVTPGQSRSLPLKLDPATQVIGVVAGFRDIDHARWRTSVAVDPASTSTVAITVGAAEVTAKAGE
ncbi:hypothetical protein P409_23070 [Inquilinus limosus MP06]|uniref:Type VI secretion protein n=2 Tax=Inquilinus limosus TaxID=171674 RepID=A0A0A0D092_9PROT|nr:hypothetical protein P409_23070 [Inquilinus limosus MP06]